MIFTNLLKNFFCLCIISFIYILRYPSHVPFGKSIEFWWIKCCDDLVLISYQIFLALYLLGTLSLDYGVENGSVLIWCIQITAFIINARRPQRRIVLDSYFYLIFTLLTQSWESLSLWHTVPWYLLWIITKIICRLFLY